MTDAITPAFNLLDEPWIPLRTQAGEVIETSLADTLLNARDCAALAETSPPNLIALYRLLLAVLHRALATQHGKWQDVAVPAGSARDCRKRLFRLIWSNGGSGFGCFIPRILSCRWPS